MPRTVDTPAAAAARGGGLSSDYSPLKNLLNFQSIDDTVLQAGQMIVTGIEAAVKEVVEVIKDLTGIDLSSETTLFQPIIDAITSGLGGGTGGALGDITSLLGGIPATIEGIVAAAIADIPTVGTDVIKSVIDAFAGGAVAELGGEVGADTTGLAAAILGGIGSLGDAIFNGLTPGQNNTGTSHEQITQGVSQLASKADTARDAATNAYNITSQFGGLLHQLIEDLEDPPIYQTPLEFLSAAENFWATFWGNLLTSLSPANPATAQNSTQIAALWAHVNPSATVGINYTFDAAVPLSNNYQGTTNPAFTAPTGFSLPTPHTGHTGGPAYIANTSTHIAVFTGNPSGAASDHGLITDRHHVSAVIGDINHGTAQLFCCGHGTTGLAQHVTLEVVKALFGSDVLNICSMTGPNAGRAVQSSYTLPVGFSINDVVAIEYDPGTNTFTMFYNSMAVGTPWPDLGNIITHGAGFRECGLYDNGQSGTDEPGLGGFVAYDF